MTAIELPYKPRKHQREAHAYLASTRFLVLVWHRQAGKTVFSVLELLLAALACTQPRGRYGYIAPWLKQAKGVAWDTLKHYARFITGVVVNESELYVELPNGARVRLFGADNPDSLRGLYFDGMVVDEVADITPSVWGEILRPTLVARQGWAIFIGTPKGVNLFSELYYRAQKEDGWRADLRRASETGAITQEEMDRARNEMSDAQWAQEMECDFNAAVDDVLLKLDEVLAAMKRTVPEQAYTSSAKILGVDVARYGGDLTVFAPRQGCVAFQPKSLKDSDTMNTAAQLAMFIDTWQPDATMVDAGGMGVGVIDRMRQLGYQVIGIDFGGKPQQMRFENKRAEMWWELGDWVKAGACLPDVTRLTQDLTAPRFTYANKRGKLQLESKDAMRARGLPSPDYGDALATTFAFPVSPRGTRSRQQYQTVHEYNPLEPR